MSVPSFSIQEDVLNTSQIKYLDVTHKLNDYNEIYNLNQHLLDNNSQEFERLNTFNNQLKNKLMKAKQSYMLMDYGIHEYEMYNNLLVFTIVVASIALFVVSKTPVEQKNKLIWGCGIIGVVYLIIMMVALSSKPSRRKYAWSQWYWSPVKKT